MNEDSSSMDKKHFGLPPSKSLGQQDSSSRPRQDGTGGSQNVNKSNFSRPPRRRESPSHASQSLLLSKNTRQENSSKPTPQKNKATMDKRPRARLSDSLQSIGEEEPEYGSIQKFGSKKQNLNHLLNFHFAPREISRNNTGSWRAYNSHPGGGWRSRSSGVAGTNSRPKFNKENFLQANCQFLVKSTGDYEVYKYDPDILVDWNMIEQIYIRVTGEFPRCPICLDQPAAAKMVKCGHIFCWPCILHYLALSDKPVRKCPICYEPIHKQELKSVVATLTNDINVGDEIEMQLMFRSKASFDAMPLMCKGGASFDWESVFSKLLIATPQEVKNLVLDREERELRRRFKEEEHCPEVCFVEQALRELDTRRSNLETSKETTQVEENKDLVSVLKTIHPVSDWLSSPDSEPLTEQLIQQNFAMNSTQQEESTTNATGQKQRCNSVESESAVAACLNYNEDVNSTKVSDKEGHYYFYQAIGGQNVFLHPLCHAILSKNFGTDTANWPQVIQFRIVEKEYVTMTDEMRKRLKFLQHLPITSNLQLVEVELKPPFVQDKILEEFSQQLDARRKRRAQRIRDERRREKVFREEEEKKRKNQTPDYKFESTLDFPEYRYEDYESVPATPSEERCPISIPTTISTDGESVIFDQQPGASSSSFSTSPSGMSFAQIVSQKSAPSFSSSSGGGAWGKSPFPLNLEAKDSRSGSELDPDEYTTVPQYRMSMSDAIQKALANISVVEETEVSESNNNGNGNGKKKGRKKGKLLFNTGIGF